MGYTVNVIIKGGSQMQYHLKPFSTKDAAFKFASQMVAGIITKNRKDSTWAIQIDEVLIGKAYEFHPFEPPKGISKEKRDKLFDVWKKKRDAISKKEKKVDENSHHWHLILEKGLGKVPKKYIIPLTKEEEIRLEESMK
jgi:hypothetical protein